MAYITKMNGDQIKVDKEIIIAMQEELKGVPSLSFVKSEIFHNYPKHLKCSVCNAPTNITTY